MFSPSISLFSKNTGYTVLLVFSVHWRKGKYNCLIITSDAEKFFASIRTIEERPSYPASTSVCTLEISNSFHPT